MGLAATTTNLTYARNDYIGQGRHHVLDKAADMMYYFVRNLDLAIIHQVAFEEDTDRTSGEGACLFANGVSIGMATPGDCQGIKMEFDYGATPTVTGDGKMAHGLDIKMTMDQDWDFGTKLYNGTIRGARIQVVSQDDVSGRLTGAYINAIAEGTKTIRGYVSGGAPTGPGIIGIQARTEIQTSATITTPGAVGIMIMSRIKQDATLAGSTFGYRGLQIELPMLGTGSSITGTTSAIYVGKDWSASGYQDVFDYGINIATGTCLRALYAACSPSGSSTMHVMEAVVTDSTATSSGDASALHLNMTYSGDHTGTGWHTALAIDYAITGNSSYAFAQSIYTGSCGDATINYLVGHYVYMDAIGGSATVEATCGLMLGINNTNAATNSTFMRVYGHGGAVGSVIWLANSAGTPITNLLDFEGLASPLSNGSDSTNCDYKIACAVGATTRYLHLFTD